MRDYEDNEEGRLPSVSYELSVSDLLEIKDELEPFCECSEDWNAFLDEFDKNKGGSLFLELLKNGDYVLSYNDSDGDNILLSDCKIAQNMVKDFIFQRYEDGKILKDKVTVDLDDTYRLDCKEYEYYAKNFAIEDIRKDVKGGNDSEEHFLNFLEDLQDKKEFVALEYVVSEDYFYPLDKSGKRNKNTRFRGNGKRAKDFKDLFLEKYKQFTIEQKMKSVNKKEYVSGLEDAFLRGRKVNEKFLEKVKGRQKVTIEFKDFPHIESENFVKSGIYKKAEKGIKDFLDGLISYQRSGSSTYEALGYFKDEDCFYYVSQYGDKLDKGGQNFEDNIGNQKFIGVKCADNDYMVAFKDVFLKLAAIDAEKYEKQQRKFNSDDIVEEDNNDISDKRSDSLE